MNGIGLFSTIGEYPNEEGILLADPYWHSYLGMLMTSPEILKYVEQDQTKLGEILHAKEELRKNLNKCASFYKKDKNRRGALKFFYARIFQLEYIARLCEINLEEFKLNFEEVGEISIKELIDIRNDIAENAESLEKYLANYPKHQKIFLEICGFENLNDIKSKKIGFTDKTPRPLSEEIICKFAGEPNAPPILRTLSQSYTTNLELIIHLINKKQTFKDFKKELENKYKREGFEISAGTISRFLSNYDPTRTLLEREWEKIQEKIQNLEEKTRKEFIRLKKRLDAHTWRLIRVREEVEGTLKSFTNPKTWFSGIFQCCLAGLMFTFGQALGLEIIEQNFNLFTKLIRNNAAKIGVGVTLTAIFIIGINVEGDWIKTIINPKKQLANALKSEIVEKSKSFGDNVKEAIKPDKAFTIGMIIGGLAIVFKSMGIPFYTTNELCDKLCEWIKTINRNAGETLHKILSFKIPLINQSIFDLLIGFILGGPAELIADTVIGTILNNAIMPIINNAITDLIIHVFTEVL